MAMEPLPGGSVGGVCSRPLTCLGGGGRVSKAGSLTEGIWGGWAGRLGVL